MITKKSCNVLVLMVGLLTFMVQTVPGAGAEMKTLDRNLEPVVVTGLPQFNGAKIGEFDNELYLYAYRSNLNKWEQIPFQIDEVVDDNGRKNYFLPDDGAWDANDELVFMAKDAGDRDPGSWISDLLSQGFVRYEIKVIDPTAPGKVGWVYLYRSTTLSLDSNLADYVRYFASQTGKVGEDTVLATNYKISNSNRGLPNGLEIFPAVGGSGQNLFDRLKFRAKVKIKIGFISFTVTIKETSIVFKGSDTVNHIDGRVRVVREIVSTIDAGVKDIDFRPPPTLFYYPYSTIIHVEIGNISGASINSGRLSIDLSDNALGMQFISANNPAPGFTIDGVSETPLDGIDNVLPDSNWIYINGDPQGTIMHFYPLSTSVGGSRKLYYQDTTSKVNDDTGDNKSYGDVGIEIGNNINPPFTMSYKGYYLGKTFTLTDAQNLAHYEKNPLQLEIQTQDFGTVPVELVTFNATVEQRDVWLVWLTATETNNFGFDIERKSFHRSQWRTVDFVPGHGTTTNPVRYEYLDRGLTPGAYTYRLKQIDTDGSFEYSPEVIVQVALPETFALLQNYPNPFNPATEIQYQIPAVVGENSASGRTILRIYNLLGKEVKKLVDDAQEPGFYKVQWDGQDNRGRQMPSGVYIYRLQSNGFVSTKKMILVR
ncbi:MAG: T9SS type A sorting domain-containing protein [bacterium]